MNDSMAKCILGFMLKDLKDKEIKGAVQYAYDLSATHLKNLSGFSAEWAAGAKWFFW